MGRAAFSTVSTSPPAGLSGTAWTNSTDRVVLPDVNLLVYAFRSDTAQHAPAREWLDSGLGGPSPVGLCSAALTGFVRVVTHPRIFAAPSTVETALEFVDALRSSPVALPAEAGRGYPRIFEELCRVTGAAGNQIPDVHLAAIAIEHGAELASHDRGFTRFPGLRHSDPL